MRILHARDFAVQPWKNGGGMTTEIAAYPAGAGFEAMEWRASMARVEAAGPFSSFPGIDRSLGLLEGAGIVLEVAGRGEIALAPGEHPAVFPGDVPVSARLPAGAILDLNIMTRRTLWRHHLSRVAVEAGAFELHRRGDVTLALVRGASGAADGQSFDDGDALLLDEADARLTLSRPCVLWIADLWRRAPA